MTDRDFIFNEKTGELQRGETVIALPSRRATLFAAFVSAGERPLTDNELRAQLGLPPGGPLWRDVYRLNKLIARLGLQIEPLYGSDFGKKRLVLHAMPKWRPTIPPPAEVPFQ